MSPHAPPEDHASRVRETHAPARSLRSDRALAHARSLRSDRAGRALGRYAATELWLGLGCYAVTGQRVCVLHLPFCYLFRKYDLQGFSGGNSVVTVFDPYTHPSFPLSGETDEQE
ncbi:hypothetical protein F2Q68_00043993 [Brassica cretica]|uniref:Uncharacterized protein n=1 Tax=Brassica cretica TaxID=69181 RepID=A0A8S9LN29_BRACR|nr:hypothetical protein F2Q68_00043993 [Brassica cretica]